MGNHLRLTGVYLVSFATLILTSRANAAQSPKEMLFGARALPPAAYLEFCQSRPADCGLSGPDVERAMARRPFPSRQSGGVWDEAFAQAKIARSQLRAQASPAAAADIVLADQPPASPA